LPVKLTTTIQNIETKVSNSYNRELILRFHDYLKNIDTSENYQNGVIKAIIHFSEFFGSSDFNTISKKEEILKFLDSKRKSIREDPEQKWITTWNDYLWRIKYFYRWLYNYLKGQNENVDEWKTPDFINIKKKRTKRLSPDS
jgi:integrase/recombinase XerD